MGAVRQSQAEISQALLNYNRAIELNPDLVEAYFNRGLLYGTLEQWDRALQDFDRVIALKPNKYSSSYTYRGYIYSLQDKLPLEIADLERVIEFQPENDRAYFNCAFV